MKKIASFTVNHNTLTKGMYVSRIDGDVVTYDVRMKTPNGGDYLSDGAMHTIEHLFATYARNTAYGDRIIYVGPMGCRTGFYFLTRDTLSKNTALQIVRDTMSFIVDFTGEIPGSKKEECGNYLDHDIESAKAVAKDMSQILEGWTENKMNY